MACRILHTMVNTAPAVEQAWVPQDTVGARLALVRQHMRWNVTEAAEACGVTPNSWRNWEADKSPRDWPRTAVKISRVTGCDYRWLVGGGELRAMGYNHDIAGSSPLVLLKGTDSPIQGVLRFPETSPVALLTTPAR